MTQRHSWNPSERSALLAALSDPETQPLQRELAGSPSEAEVRRMWQTISGRGAAGASVRRARLAHLLAPRFALAVAALVCAVALVFWLRADAGPLTAANAPLASTFESHVAGSTVALSDRSRIHLSPETRLDVLGNDKRTFVTTLRHGKATFEVEPGGPRRWVVEAGLVSVEVVGTIFSVSRDEESVTVSVERGIVLVRGEIAGGERRLTAGQSLVARGTPRPSRRAESAADSAIDSVAPTAAAAQPAGRKLALEDLPEDIEEGGAASAPTASGEPSTPSDAPTLPIPPPSAGTSRPGPAVRPSGQDAIDAVLADADAARRQGNVARAATLYEEAAVKAAMADPRRGMAALSYARLGVNPARAAVLLEAAQSSMPPALAEAALAHLTESHGLAGHAKEADAAARRYLETYPHHPRADKVKRWLSGP